MNCQVKCATLCWNIWIGDFRPKHFRGLELMRNRLWVKLAWETKARFVFWDKILGVNRFCINTRIWLQNLMEKFLDMPVLVHLTKKQLMTSQSRQLFM